MPHGVGRQTVTLALARELLHEQVRKLGLIEYNGGLKVNSSLLSIVLHDWSIATSPAAVTGSTSSRSLSPPPTCLVPCVPGVRWLGAPHTVQFGTAGPFASGYTRLMFSETQCRM
jgi:DNA polymerase III delta prime subunit